MISKLPPLRDPLRYRGLYIFDFGDRVVVGYTAEEIEYLLSEPQYAGGVVYKIQRAHADGTLELRGVSPSNWSRATGIVFWFDAADQARAAYDELRNRAEGQNPPGLIDLTLCHLASQMPGYAMVMRYVQELDEAVSSWLLELDYDAGIIVEGGAAPVHQVAFGAEQLEHCELEPTEFYKSRSRDEVLETVRFAVQR